MALSQIDRFEGTMADRYQGWADVLRDRAERCREMRP